MRYLWLLFIAVLFQVLSAFAEVPAGGESPEYYDGYYTVDGERILPEPKCPEDALCLQVGEVEDVSFGCVTEGKNFLQSERVCERYERLRMVEIGDKEKLALEIFEGPEVYLRSDRFLLLVGGFLVFLGGAIALIPGADRNPPFRNIFFLGAMLVHFLALFFLFGYSNESPARFAGLLGIGIFACCFVMCSLNKMPSWWVKTGLFVAYAAGLAGCLYLSTYITF